MMFRNFAFAFTLPLAVMGCQKPEDHTLPDLPVTTGGNGIIAIGELLETPSSSVVDTPPEGVARIVVFKDRKGAVKGYRSKIRLDGEPIGNCLDETLVVHDVVPGNYKVSMRTDFATKESISVSAGDVVYIECSFSVFTLSLALSPKLDVLDGSEVSLLVKSRPWQVAVE